MASTSAVVDRQTTTPFLLKVFYKAGSFPAASDIYAHPTPPHLTLYTWHTTTLHELAHQLAADLPSSALPHPVIGTRLAFRLIYPDTRSLAAGGPSHRNGNDATPRYLTKDLGSVVLGDGGPGVVDQDDEPSHTIGRSVGDPAVAESTLRDARFVIGDYVAVAIVPPTGNGNVAPAPAAGNFPTGTGREKDMVVRGSREERMGGGYGKMDRVRENGSYGRDGDSFRGRGRGGQAVGAGRESGPRGVVLPSGEWRRGERLPDGPSRGGFGGGRGRERW